MQINYRFLSTAPTDFAALHAAFAEAFSDYIVPFKLSETQFENHIRINAVDLNRSVGAFAGEKMIGFSLNGFGDWNGKPTAYDAGTGVIPDFRKRGVGAEVFEFMTPRLKADGIAQILLEVITTNEKALRLYRRIGFRQSRKLLIFEQAESFKSNSTRVDFEIREIDAPDWNRLKTFCDAGPSWQNTFAAVARNSMRKILLGAFTPENVCVGYAAMFSKYGVVASLAVEKNFRRRGVASQLLYELQKKCEKDKTLRFNNIDSKLENAVGFLKKRNFNETFSQFEMIKKL